MEWYIRYTGKYSSSRTMESRMSKQFNVGDRVLVNSEDLGYINTLGSISRVRKEGLYPGTNSYWVVFDEGNQTPKCFYPSELTKA